MVSTRNAFQYWIPVLVLMLAGVALAAKPKKAKEPPSQPALPGEVLPQDLNKASLRVIAVDTLYELDLTREQLHALRKAAEGCASNAERSEPKGNSKLTAALDDLNRALLEGNDDALIAKLRNQLSELSTADDVHLDDEVRPSAAALAKAGAITRQLTASQIAAYLASHADEVADPVELMVSSLPVLHDAGPAAEADTQDTADEVARLAVGLDDGRVPALSGKVLAWFKSNRDLSDEDLASRHTALEESARKIIGEPAPMDVLGHWMDHQIAVLLSNPQLPEAINAMLAAKERV